MPSLLPLLVLLSPVFDDPAVRGMPFKTVYPLIPEEYLGEWASTKAQCGRSNPANPNLVFEKAKVNGSNVKAVWAYSDYPAIQITLGDDASGYRILHFDISQDEMWLKANDGRREGNKPLRRCPVRTEPSEQDKMLDDRMQTACRHHDRDGFLDVFFSSPPVRRSALSRRVAVIRGDAPQRLWPREYYRFPPFGAAAHIIYYDNGTDQAVPLKMQTVELPGKGMRIDWEEEQYGEEGDAADNLGNGIRGRLTFRYVHGCWKLVSDEIRWTDWP